MYKGRYERKKEKPKAGKILLIVLAVILVLIIAAGAAGYLYYTSVLGKMNQVEVPEIEYTQPVVTQATEASELDAEHTEPSTVVTEPPHVASAEDYVNILVVGQSARAGEEDRRADTMILVTLNKFDKTVRLTSILRDTQLQVPVSFQGKNYGKIKINTIYHLGSFYDNGNPGSSMALMNLTLYKNFGIEVDHNFEVDFDAFVKIVDMLDGVEMELTEAEAKYLNDDDLWVYYDVEPGLQRLDGMAALSYARMRKAEGDADSDIKRSNRQRNLIVKLIEKMKNTSIGYLRYVIDETMPYITTSMSTAEITKLMFDLLEILPEMKIVTGGTCPVEDTYQGKMVDIYDIGQLESVLTFNVDQQWRLMREITLGEGRVQETEPAEAAEVPAN